MSSVSVSEDLISDTAVDFSATGVIALRAWPNTKTSCASRAGDLASSTDADFAAASFGSAPFCRGAAVVKSAHFSSVAVGTPVRSAADATTAGDTGECPEGTC